VQHVDAHSSRRHGGVSLKAFGNAALLAHARQKDQHIALAVGERLAHHPARGRVEAFIAARRAVVRRDGIHPPGTAHDGRRALRIGEQGRDGVAIERGRHDQHAQVVAQLLLRFEHQREAQIPLQRALVKLVEEDRAVAVEGRVRRQ